MGEGVAEVFAVSAGGRNQYGYGLQVSSIYAVPEQSHRRRVVFAGSDLIRSSNIPVMVLTRPCDKTTNGRAVL